MKKILEKLFIFLLGLLLVTSCEQEINDYTLQDLGSAPATPATVVVDEVAEDYFTMIEAPADYEGRKYYVVLPDGAATPDPYAVIAGTANVVVSDFFNSDATENDTITVENLDMVATYNVYTFAVSATGIASGYSSAVNVSTFDESGPVISGFSPEYESMIFSMDENIVLTFNEAVSYVSGKQITLFADNATYNETITADDMIIEGNVVTILHDAFPYEDYINLTMDEGAFIDEYGNESGALLVWDNEPNYYIETCYSPASALVGTWTVTEISIYDGTYPTYEVEIELGENENELVVSYLWSFTVAIPQIAERMISTVIQIDQETGYVTCPFQDSELFLGPDAVTQSFSNAFSSDDGVYGFYEASTIVFDAKLFLSGAGIFDQSRFILVPAPGGKTIKKSEKKYNEITEIELKEKF